jgi:putative ABC transport system ATP-binding protein
MTAPIVTNDLCKTYGESALAVHAVVDATLSFQEGEMVGLFGPSGSGKTTLLSMIGCLLKPNGGTLSLYGHDVAGQRESALSALRKQYISFIFQGFNLFPALTAFENVMLGLYVKGERSASAERQARKIIDEVGLADRSDFLPRDLSGGQKQRVSVARALATSSPIILADEPTANLDLENGRKIMEMLHSLAKRQNKCVIVATHDNRIWNAFDRILLMEDGKIERKLTRKS